MGFYLPSTHSLSVIIPSHTNLRKFISLRYRINRKNYRVSTSLSYANNSTLVGDVKATPFSSATATTLGCWLPVGSVSALKNLVPVPVRIVGGDYTVWKDEKDNWSVLVDACPHRLAPLSQGRVDPKTGCIECPYHGWQFNTNGECTDVPQMERRSDAKMRKGLGERVRVVKQ